MPDPASAAKAGITTDQIADVVRTAVRGRVFPIRGGTIKLSMGVSLADCGKLLIRRKDGKMVPLENIAQIETVTAPAALERVNGRRCLTIAATAQSPATPQTVKESLRGIANDSRDKLKLPADYQVVDE